MTDRYDDNSIRQGSHADHAVDRSLGPHDGPTTTGDAVGETVGGLSGIATGAALGSLGGPIGTIIGGIAGAAAGWWTGRAVSEAASTYDHEDEYYRGHHTSGAGSTTGGVLSQPVGDTAHNVSAAAGRAADRVEAGVGHAADRVAGGVDRTADRVAGRRYGYDDVRPAYQLGHVAGMNPDYQGRRFEDVGVRPAPWLRRARERDRRRSGLGRRARLRVGRLHAQRGAPRGVTRGVTGLGKRGGRAERVATPAGAVDGFSRAVRARSRL